MRPSVVLAFAAALLIGSVADASSQTLTSDKPDYAPGEIATLTGAGFAPGEEVTLRVGHAEEAVPDSGADHEHWDVTADDEGGFVALWHVCEDDCIGATLRATADGAVSGLHAEVTFTDAPKVQTTTLGAQSPDPLAAGGSATYLVSVKRDGANDSFTASLAVTTALPAGASASFSPASLSFPSANPNITLTSTLTISSNGCTTPSGTSSFTVRASRNAGDFAAATGGLVVTAESTPPAVSCPAPTTVQAGAGCKATVPNVLAGITASDNCTPAGSLIKTQNPSAGTLVGLGTHAITVTVTDAAGNSNTCSTSFTVVDNSPPSIALDGPANMTIECHSPFSDPGASASDLCAGDLINEILAVGNVNPDVVGSYVLTYMVSDGNGNNASVTRTVEVVDTTPPVLSLAGASSMTIECHSAFGDPGASASDLCAGDLSGAIQVSGSVDANAVGSYTLTYLVNDGHGNSASVTRTVEVVDTTPPVLSLAGASSMSIECHSAFGDPGASASDLCAGDLSGAIQVSGSVDANAVGSYTLTYLVNDGHGNSASVTRTVDVVDTTPPVLSLSGASSMSIECHSAFGDPGASASDLCAGDLSGAIQVSGSVDANAVGSYTLTYLVNDGHGNSASVTRTVEVVDTTPPVLSLSGASSMSIECHSPFGDPGASASDLCAGDLSGAIQVSGSVDANAVGSYTLTYLVNDGHGNSASVTRTVEVVDTTPPVLSLMGSSSMTIECHSAFGDPGASASDLCAGDLSGAIQVSGSVDANTVGSYTLTYLVNDGHGNSASVTRTVEVVDTTPPVLSLAGASSITIECHSAFGDPGASASDLCAGDLSGAIQVSGSVDANAVGSYTLTYLVNDGHGNSASVTRTVEVVDTTPPVLSLAGASSMTIECHSPFGDPGASASDLCAGDLSGAIQVLGSVDANTVGSYTLTYLVNDGNGNGASVTRTVEVVDTTPPVLNLSGASSMTIECHSAFGDPGASASDLCAGDLSGAIQVSGSVDANTVGSYTLTYLVNDGHGNSASVTRTVEVVDTTKPSLDAPPAVTVYTGPGATSCGAIVSADVLGQALASDLCAGSTTAVCTGMPVGGLFPVGVTTLTHTATDPSGNSATATQTVTVIDNTVPVLAVPAAVSMNTGPGATACGTVVSDLTLGTASASDNCPGVVLVRSGVPAGNLFPVGTTTLTYLATDAHGNMTQSTQAVVVADNTPPSLTVPTNITQLVAAGSCAAPVSFTAGVSDNCAGASVVCSPASGYAFPIGTTTVTCTATDAAGNQTTGSFTVTVSNPPPSVAITGPVSGSVVAIGTPVALAGSFTDNAGDSHVAQWSLDGVNTPGAVNEAAGTVSGSYTFSAAGVYFLKLTVTDQCGGAGTATQVGGLDAMVVVYDPNAGFVTGGGWINSPAGAYAPDPSKVGKANFGFVSKYAKGSNVPTGETEFQFKVADVNFHSTSYDWLVVSGAKAQYKGSGTINGTGNYGFLLSAVDGQINGGGGADKFRMKIVNKATGSVVYDNQMGAADTTTATTVIAGGSIVIHSPSKGGASTTSARGVEGSAPSVASPLEYSLAQNGPNPFSESTQIAFELPERSHVRLTVYDIAGREIASLANEDREAGFHVVSWSGRGNGGSTARGGVYFVRIVAESLTGSRQYSSLRKMIRVD